MGKVLRFKKKYLEGIVNGRKVTTIRRSTKLREGDLVDIVVGGEVVARARISGVRRKRLGDLTDADARVDGFKNASELKRELRKIYGKRLREDSDVYVIGFEVIEKESKKRND